MHLNISEDDLAFRDEVRAFLAANLTDEMRVANHLNGGSFADFAISRRWFLTLSEKGWVAPSWPKEHGGCAWTPMQKYIYSTEAARAGTPAYFAMGISMVGPVVMRFGTEAQKAHFLPRILSGDDIWCQGYSEPGAGSDLASLQTRAVADGDDYVINGTKIWTTGAHVANHIFCLVRTADTERRQEGISFLLFRMDTPGITVKPIINIAGEHTFNQVFFDDVRVPRSSRLGDENDGWTVAKYLLEFERGGSAHGATVAASLAKLRAVAEGHALDDPLFAHKVAAAAIRQQAAEYTEHRIIAEITRQGRPGTASSTMKVMGSETNQAITELTVEALDYYMAPFQPEARKAGSNVKPIAPAVGVAAVAKYLHLRAASIYSGSNEIQRNIMAKRVLGL
ncbi:MAG: acyl-CoA dehydrogenase family protein [Alphaproteobacteria bacterium]